MLGAGFSIAGDFKAGDLRAGDFGTGSAGRAGDRSEDDLSGGDLRNLLAKCPFSFDSEGKSKETRRLDDCVVSKDTFLFMLDGPILAGEYCRCGACGSG